MAEWLVEEGIGEHRAIQHRGGDIVAARLDWPGRLTAGQIDDATLTSRMAGSPRGTASFPTGEEALVDRLPKDAQEGAPIRLEVTRSAIAERGRLKRAQSRPTDAAPRPAPSLADTLRKEGHSVSLVRQFPAEADWEDVFAEAWFGAVQFPGGELLFAETPAMTLIDIDGSPPARAAQAAIPAIARAITRFDMGGSIGIDFPTLQTKAERKLVDAALAEQLDHWPHERTAMNGFGFVHLVARLQRPSLLQRITRARVGAAARLLLRRAERVAEPGALLLTAHPGVKAKLKPEWLEELARRTGREIRLESDPALALNGGFAQAVPL